MGLKPELKVSGINKVPIWALEKIPITVTLIITDVEGNRYQSDIDMDNGFNAEHMREATAASFSMCEFMPKECRVESVIKRATGFEHKN